MVANKKIIAREITINKNFIIWFYDIKCQKDGQILIRIAKKFLSWNGVMQMVVKKYLIVDLKTK